MLKKLTEFGMDLGDVEEIQKGIYVCVTCTFIVGKKLQRDVM